MILLPNFLFLSISAGSGHNVAAQAVIQEIKVRYPDSNTKVIDTFDYMNPLLNKLAIGGYIHSIKLSPWLWGHIYNYLESQERHLFDVSQLFTRLYSEKFINLINDFKPDTIICTHPIPARIISNLKDKRQINIPLIALITDFTVHHYWIHKNIDAYILPCEQLKEQITKFGVSDDKLILTGIPLRRQFSRNFYKIKVREELGLEQKTTVLIMGGGNGLGHIDKIVKALMKSNIDLQVVTITGKNEKLCSKLLSFDTGKKVKVFGYVENMAKLMAAADIVITKPGGVTTAEILTMGLPMIIVNPLPGQEIRNTEFLINNKLGVKVGTIDQLEPLIKKLTNDKLFVSTMKNTAKEIAKPQSAESFVKYLGKYA